MTLDTITDPSLIRQAIDLAEQTSGYRAAKTYGINHTTVYRWVRRREESGGVWPTDADVNGWLERQTDLGPERRRKRLMMDAYRKRVYLQRGPMHIPNTGTVRRLHALMAMGHTYSAVAGRMCVTPARVAHLAMGINPIIHRDTVAVVASIYDDMCMTVPAETYVARRQRGLAAARGYAVPLSWDDDTIDDPDAKPARTERDVLRHDRVDPVVVQRILAGDWRLKATRAEKEAVTARWTGKGGSLNELESLTGWRAHRYVEDGAA